MPPESQNNQAPNTPTSEPQPAPAGPSPSRPEPVPQQQPQFPGGPQPAYSQQAPAKPPKKSNKKRWLLAGIIALIVLLGGSAAAYFGYYVPNQPDQVWKRAMSNSAAGVDRLSEYYESRKEANKKGLVKGNFKLEESGNVVDGNLETKYDPVNTATKLDTGFMGIRLNAEILTNIPEGAEYPDVYAKVSGLEGLDQILGGEAGAAVNGFNDQWYVVDHTLFDQMMSASANQDEPAPSLSGDDFDAIVQAINRVNREYVFTDDPNKAIFTRTQDVGREQLNDRDTYHYKVGYNKENLKAYSNSLKDALNETKLKDYLKDSDYDKLNSEIDKLSGEGEADAWVDMKTKLIRQIRFNNVDQKGGHVDVALNYNGGDEYPFAVTMVSVEENNEGTTTIGATLNTKTHEIKFNADGEGEADGQPLKFNLAATLTPSEETVEFSKPENTKSLLEAFGGLMGGNGAFSDPAGFAELNEL